MLEPTDTTRATRSAQDTLILLAIAIGAVGIVGASGTLPIPMINCLALPIALIACLLFAGGYLVAGRLEVSWWRQILGIVAACVGLFLFFRGHIEGMNTIVEHYIGREGAPPLTRVLRSVPWLGLASITMAGAARARRRGDCWVAVAHALVMLMTGVFGWGFLILLGYLGAPFTA